MWVKVGPRANISLIKLSFLCGVIWFLVSKNFLNAIAVEIGKGQEYL